MPGAIAAGNDGTCGAGIATLHAGGNAVDAAISAIFASYVCEPLLSSAGGGGLMLVKPPDASPSFVDFFPRAPRHSHANADDAPRDFHAVDIDFGETAQRFHVGRASVAAPTTFEVLADTHQRWGRLPLSDVLAPAIQLAEQGHPIGVSGAEVFRLLWPIVSLDRDTLNTLTNGAPPTPDEILRNPRFGQLLREFGEHGRPPPRIRASLLRDFGRDAGGLLSPEDLDVPATAKVRPHHVQHKDWHIWTANKPGGHALTEILSACHIPPQHEARFVVSLADAVAKADPSLRGVPSTRGSTTQLSITDAEGFAVSVTTSNGEGCGYVLGDTGIFMNNFLGEEDLNPGGFFQHRGGDPLPTMMAPTIALSPDSSLVVLGSGGANRIRSAVSATLLRMMHGASLHEAIMAPRVHAEGQTVWLERPRWQAPATVEAALEAAYETLIGFDRRAFFFGGVHGVVHTSSGEVAGAGDPRRSGVYVRQ